MHFSGCIGRASVSRSAGTRKAPHVALSYAVCGALRSCAKFSGYGPYWFRRAEELTSGSSCVGVASEARLLVTSMVEQNVDVRPPHHERSCGQVPDQSHTLANARFTTRNPEVRPHNDQRVDNN